MKYKEHNTNVSKTIMMFFDNLLNSTSIVM